MKTLFYVIKLIRPLNTITAGVAMVIASSILSGFEDLTNVTYTMLVVMAYTAGANSLNDAVDHLTDIVNRPDRPIRKGMVSRSVAITISFLLFLSGTLLALKLNRDAVFIGVIIAMPIMVVYNTHLKGKPLIGNIAVSMVIAISFLFCGAAHQNFGPMWLPAVLSFGLTLLREIVKDVADLEGDLSVGLATYPILAGVHKSRKLILFICFLVGLLASYPFLHGIYGLWYGIIVLIGVEIPIIIVVVLFVNNPGILSAKQSSKILKFSSIMGLIAIYAGSQL